MALVPQDISWGHTSTTPLHGVGACVAISQHDNEVEFRIFLHAQQHSSNASQNTD